MINGLHFIGLKTDFNAASKLCHEIKNEHNERMHVSQLIASENFYATFYCYELLKRVKLRCSLVTKNEKHLRTQLWH